jgi:hypothetical protein
VNRPRRPSSSCFEKALRGSVPVVRSPDKACESPQRWRWQAAVSGGGTSRPRRSGSWRWTPAKPASCPSPPAEAGSRLVGDGERAQARRPPNELSAIFFHSFLASLDNPSRHQGTWSLDGLFAFSLFTL